MPCFVEELREERIELKKKLGRLFRTIICSCMRKGNLKVGVADSIAVSPSSLTPKSRNLASAHLSIAYKLAEGFGSTRARTA